MKNVILLLTLLANSASVFAEKRAVVCNNCDYNTMKSLAGKVSQPNDTINILDFSSNKMETFKNYVEWDFEHGESLDIHIKRVTLKTGSATIVDCRIKKNCIPESKKK